MKPIRSFRNAPERAPVRGAVESFLDHLCAQPFEEWVRIGRVIELDALAASRRTEACARVASAIESLGLAVDAWTVGDAIETLAFIARRAAGGRPRAQRRAFAAARAAAEAAGLALLVGDRLSAADHRTLVRPFL